MKSQENTPQTTPFPVVNHSKKVRELCERVDTAPSGEEIPSMPSKRNARYPFLELAVGQSFLVPFAANPNVLYLRQRASYLLGRRFVVLVHDDKRVVEVARIG